MGLDVSSDMPHPPDDLLLGRKSEIQQLTRHFAGGGRLAQISGRRGTGKTALALNYLKDTQADFPGGITFLRTFPPQSLRSLMLGAIRPPIQERTLVIVDDLDLPDESDLAAVSQLLREYPSLDVLLIGQLPVEIPDIGMLSIPLEGLNRKDFGKLLQRGLGFADNNVDLVDRLYQQSLGNPLLAAQACQSITDGAVDLRGFLNALGEFEYQAVLGADGRPYGKGLAIPRRVVAVVTTVNAELLARLRANPELLRALPPGKFEEVVAELLKRQGYSVQLTPTSRDGGFDMYAAKDDGVGQFLYLVECKRYTPPDKVGVQVVRSLHGVVQQTRATAGVIATTSFFTNCAKEFQKQIRYQLHLRDYIELQKWLGLVK